MGACSIVTAAVKAAFRARVIAAAGVAVLILFTLNQPLLIPASASTAGSPDTSPHSEAARALSADTPAAGLNPAALTPAGRLLFAAANGGAWSLYTADPNGGPPQRLAVNATPARDPAVSPDGQTVVFRSHRDGFWEIYTMPAAGGTATRLTRGMMYSGAPTWSPDGRKIAFESYARGDLDIWVMNADGSQAIDLTGDSSSYDYAPAWSPDGKWIAFTTWRTGTQQIFVISVDGDCTGSSCKKIYNLSQNQADDFKPAWSPNGKKIAFVSDREDQRAIYVADFSPAGLKNARRVTFSGWDDQPAWSPDGQWIAFVSARPDRQPIYMIPSNGGVPRALDNGDGDLFAESVNWTLNSVLQGTAPADLDTSEEGRPDLAASGSGHPYDLRRITSTRLDPGINKLNSRIADSFVDLQARVKQELGYDFLGVLADMARAVDYKCDITCDTLSWHKAGRAFDTRLDYTDSRGSALEVVREDQQGETFWRVFLRPSAQDGSLGEPMKDTPWDLGYRARWIVGRGDGGIKKPIPYGFYVDFTELAREYGWDRISAQDSEDFNWRTNKIGAEYWHFQRKDGLNWYQAIREVYSEKDLNSLGDWNALAGRYEYMPSTLYLKGIPTPAKSWRWSVLGP